jgi:hypothetical protein
VQLPFVEGIITAPQMLASAEAIAEWQLPTGMIPWIPGGHADPWNHVEAAMALATCGLIPEAELAYEWLAKIQRPDGSWHNYYVAGGIEDAKFDANCIAYIATGVWHHWLVTRDRDFVERYWPVVEPAIEFVLELQTKRGEVIWASRPDGTPWSYALLTGSSSINHSLECGALLADLVGKPRPHWMEARQRLIRVIADEPDAFEPKDRWAMDWYYPVLTGAIVGEAARDHLASRWQEFIMQDKGCRCVHDRPWVTAAETCECVIAHLAAGERAKAEHLFRSAQTLRDDADGRYYTGLVYPELIHFPELEKSTYTAAAVILAADALQGANPTSNLFTDHS